MTIRLFLFVVTALLAHSAFAGDLAAPFSLESATVLPKGVRSLRMTGLSTSIKDAYDNNGRVEGSADSLNKQVIFKDLVSSFPKEMKNSIEGIIRGKDYTLDTTVGNTHGVVNSRVSALVPVMAYGATEKLTLAVAVPVIRSSVNVDTGWTANSVLSDTLQALSKKGYHDLVLAHASKLKNVVQARVEAKGYRRLEDQNKTQIGDVALVAKYQLLKFDRVAVAVQPRVVLPTGRRADIHNLVDVGGGDGQWDIGVGSASDYTANARLTFTGALGYVAQLPDKVAARVPEQPNETLTADVDPSVRMDLGDIVSGSVGARYKIVDTWTAGVAAGLHYKGPDRYRGGRFGSARYGWMSNDTEQTLTTAQAAITHSTVPLYSAKRFALPLETSANYASVLSGRNARRGDIAALELVVYF